MYAMKSINEVYHLIQRGGLHTLCGLRLSRVASERNLNRVQLVEGLPADKKICKHCERINRQDSL